MAMSETPRRRGGGEWGPPLTAEEEAPPAVDLIAARRAALAAQAAAAPSPAAPSSPSAPPSTPRRGGGEWGPPVTADQAVPVTDALSARRAALAATGAPPAAPPPFPPSTAAPSVTTPGGDGSTASAAGPRTIPQLANFDRVREMLRRYGLDAVVCALPHNVYYLSGLDTPPLWEFPWYAFAVVPRVGDPALVLSNLALSAPTEAALWIHDYYPVFRGELINYDAVALLESEQRLKALSDRLAPRRSETNFEALVKVFKDRALLGKKIGFDDSRIVPRLPESNFTAFDAIELMREVRMIKTEPEIAAMREAAIANEEAALEAIRFIPNAATWEEVVRRYKAALALRGGDGRYLLGGSPHHTGTHQHMFRDYRPQRGEWFMIDALGAKAHYLGDFGRTVSWGEPSPTVVRRFNALRKGFEAGLAMVKPGVRFEEIAARVRETVHREGFTEYSVCVPHSVGLEHTDSPRRPGLTVELNMTMNIDIAYLEAGFGQLHLEDTFVVRASGPELLTSGKTDLIVLP
ncbi:MAG: M24 family metallopeptidase [Chloroflexota bacterium]|nr:M24 family metallopeptidase [Dehalococcoidia bacterium]MDW8254791.1 M24 family metallopeptidase [Chloroflexota bacterium]